MKINVELLRNNTTKALADLEEWEEGKLAERIERWKRMQDAQVNRQIELHQALINLCDEFDKDQIVTKERAVEILDGVPFDMRSFPYKHDILTLEEVKANGTPHYTQTKAMYEKLLRILAMTEDKTVSTYALAQAGYGGHIPL